MLAIITGRAAEVVEIVEMVNLSATQRHRDQRRVPHGVGGRPPVDNEGVTGERLARPTAEEDLGCARHREEIVRTFFNSRCGPQWSSVHSSRSTCW
jgi:hypothetical protein